MERKYKENSFFQAAQNVKKLGAYYTDVGHCRRIGMLFDFDSAEEICVLEPSVGDGKAVLEVTGGRENIRLYGVEIQKETYDTYLKNNKKFSSVLNEDFLRGVKISRGVFSFVFANPPYGVQNEDGEGKRLELLFLEKLTNYLRPGAYVTYVIPHSTFTDEKFFRAVMTRFEICSYYKFDEAEYAKFHQVAVISRKKRSGLGGYMSSVFAMEYEKARRLEDYPYLPESPDDVTEKYEVLPSKDSDIEYFTTRDFDVQAAEERLDFSSLYSVFGDETFQKKYMGCDLNRPIVPVSKEISYLLAVSGGGQGLAGNEEEGTLHLQRGVARRVEEDTTNYNEKSSPTSVTATSYTKIKLNIIQNNGVITQL